jgi:hypothetical protein
MHLLHSGRHTPFFAEEEFTLPVPSVSVCIFEYNLNILRYPAQAECHRNPPVLLRY